MRYAVRRGLLLTMLLGMAPGCSDAISGQSSGLPWGLGEQAPDEGALAAQRPVLNQDLLGGYVWRQRQITAALCNDSTFDYTFDLDGKTHALDTTSDVYQEPGDGGCGQRSVLEVGTLEVRDGVLYLEREGELELMQVAVVEEIPRRNYNDGEPIWEFSEKPLLTNQAFVSVDRTRYVQSFTQPSYAQGRDVEIELTFNAPPLDARQCEVDFDVRAAASDGSMTSSRQQWRDTCSIEALDRGWFVISLAGGETWTRGDEYDLAESIRDRWNVRDRYTWLVNGENPNVLYHPYFGQNGFGEPWFHALPREDARQRDLLTPRSGSQ